MTRKRRDFIAGGALGITIATLGALTFYDMDICSVWLIGLVIPIAIFYQRKADNKRKERLLEEFRDGLSYVKNALDAGASAENAFGAALMPLKKLYGDEAEVTKAFGEICRKIQNGNSLEQAVSDFAESSGVADIEYFADIFPVLKRTGGDMNMFINRVIININEKQSLKRELNAVTAEKRNEFRIMCLIPLAMIIYLRIFSPEMMAGLYHNTKGILFMTLMIFLYMVCILGGRWILKKHLG